MLERYNIPVFLYIEISMIVSLSFGHVKLFPLSDGFVFGMPEHQIRNMQALSQLSGVFDGAVMFLIRLEAVTLFVEAECLVKQPVAAFHVRLAIRIVRLITGTGQLFAVFQNGGEAKLPCFCGVDIEEGDIVIQDMQGFAVMDRDQMNAVSLQKVSMVDTRPSWQ